MMTSQSGVFTLADKKILVTGASSGIGRGIAVSCSRMGAKLIITGRNESRLSETMDSLSGSGHISVQGDLTVDADIMGIANKADKLDGVVHCAGIDPLKPAKMLNRSDIESVMGVNFTAPALLQAALINGKNINRGASIVFLSSISAKRWIVGQSLYSASKAALIAYANTLAVELAPRKIRVNSICPAMVWTNLIESSALSAEEHKEREKSYLLGRYGTTEDVANCAVYLLSDASSWVTGSSFDLTGGGER